MKKILLTFILFCGIVAKAQEMPVIDVIYNGASASVNIPAEATGVMLNSATGSSAVSIYNGNTTTELCFRISGNSQQGSLLIQGNYKMTLELAGVNLKSNAGAAIDIECGKRIAVVLKDGTTNTLEDAAIGAQKAAMYFSGHPEFDGAGTLNVRGNVKHAISAKEYLEMKATVGTINVLAAASDGIHCGKGKAGNENNYFEMKGGVLNVSNVGSDCIDSDDYGCVKIKGGRLNLDVAALGGSGIKCDSIFKMNDGELNLNISGADAEGIRVNHTANFNDGDITINISGAGSKGIKAKQETMSTVINGGFANFNGTDIEISLSGDNYTDIVKDEVNRCMGISVDQDMVVNGGDILVTRLSSQSKSHNVKGDLTVVDGKYTITGNRYVCQPEQFQFDKMMYVAIVDGKRKRDYANWHIAAFNGSEQCCGVADVVMVKGNHIYLPMRVRSNVSSEKILVRAYNAASEEEMDIITPVTFSTSSLLPAGTPSSPKLLNTGNVNDDSHVAGIADIAALITYVGKSGAEGEPADIDANGTVNLVDLELLKTHILNK